MFNRKQVWGLAVAALALLAACGNGGSGVETRDRAAEDARAVLASATGIAAVAGEAGPRAGGGGEGGQPAPAGPPAPPAEAARARPALTANRRESVDAKTERLFRTNGADFGAATADEYLDKVRAFTARPPADVERVERPNGDVLLYQASTNTFAVVSREGVAKTMFKPRDGAAYWAEQKAAAPAFGTRRGRSGDGG